MVFVRIACVVLTLNIVGPTDLAWADAGTQTELKTNKQIEDKTTPGTLEERVTTLLKNRWKDVERLAKRKHRFSQTTVVTSAFYGVPIRSQRVLKDYDCGGRSGPGCSWLTLALETVKFVAPSLSRFVEVVTDEQIIQLVDAIDEHSFWHDLYGYLYTSSGVGPGYVYAGCLLFCNPKKPMHGQVEGIIFQLLRLRGNRESAECGPLCPKDLQKILSRIK